MTLTLSQLQKENKEWTTYNFGAIGTRRATHPCLGIIEEVGELIDAIDAGKIEDIDDAVGDAMIYMADYCNIMSLDLNLIYEQARSRAVDDREKTILVLLTKLAHHHLKYEQGIRNLENHLLNIQDILSRIVNFLYYQSNNNFMYVVESTWKEVKKRDWRKSPNDANKR